MQTIETEEGTLTLVSRADWRGGDLRQGYNVDPARFTALVSHHTVMDFGKPGLLGVGAYMRRLQTIRPDLRAKDAAGDYIGLPEVPYSWVIFPDESEFDAIIAEGRGAGRTGAHTAGQNSSTYGIAWAGNTNDMRVTPGMIRAFRYIGEAFLEEPSNARRTQAHRETYATECPGASGMDVLPLLQPPFEPGGRPEVIGRPVLALTGYTSQGPWVSLWRRQLHVLLLLLGATDNAAKFDKDGAGRDTVFTTNLYQWTRAFQVWYNQQPGLGVERITVDGIVGTDETWPAMAQALTDHSVRSVQKTYDFEPIGLGGIRVSPDAWQQEVV